MVLGIIRELKEQHNLPLEEIKRLLELRAQHGDLHMNMALKQRSLRSFGGHQAQLTREELIKQAGITSEQLETLLEQGLLFPIESEQGLIFTGDDVLLLDLYQHLEQFGLTLALPALIRFQLRQIVRSEIAAYEQDVLPHWQAANLPLEQQTAQFEKILALTDTLISILHRKLLYHN